jgi:hypothetical protein
MDQRTRSLAMYPIVTLEMARAITDRLRVEAEHRALVRQIRLDKKASAPKWERR